MRRPWTRPRGHEISPGRSLGENLASGRDASARSGGEGWCAGIVLDWATGAPGIGPQDWTGSPHAAVHWRPGTGVKTLKREILGLLDRDYRLEYHF